MKKNQLLAALLFALAPALSAQVCGNPQSQIDLHGNNIQARLLNGGDLFWDLTQGKFIPNPAPDGTGPSSIFNAGLWLGGLDSNSDLHLAAVTYRSGGKIDYFAGPLSPDGQTSADVCSNWDRHFIVRGDRIAAFLDSLPFLVGNPGLAKAQFPEIMGWPGRFNPFFFDAWGFDLPATGQGLAPFNDTDLDGAYNPLKGDYPAVMLRFHPSFVPTEMVWCVFNDQGAGALHASTGGKPLPVEVQLTAWAFDSVSQPLLANTVFTSHKLIFRGTQAIDSCFVGMWVNFDIGCAADDYLGTAPALNAYYSYNQDAVDGNFGSSCSNWEPTFGAAPPVQSATFLNRSLDKCIYYNDAASSPIPPSGTTDPASTQEYYYYLTGRWRDGKPLTYGQSGYQSGGAETNYVFPDPPSDPNGWSMCTAGLTQNDRRIIGSHQLGQVVPGQIEELNVAWTVHPHPALPCGLGTTFSDIAAIRHLYDNNFVTATTTPLLEASVKLSPNPAANAVTIDYDNLSVLEIRCFDAAGRLIRTVQGLPDQQYLLDVAGWHTGTYTVQVLTREGVMTQALVVLH